MVEYLPWKKDVLEHALALQSKKRMSVLDLDLTAKCSEACCLYCDSRPAVGEAHAEEMSWETLKSLLEQGKAEGLEWIYTCGLGEPLEDSNFWFMLDLLKTNSIRLSIFSNGIFIDNLTIAKKLKDAGVCIILKMDTFDEEKFDKILGNKDGAKGKAKKIYKALDLLLQAGYARDEAGSDLAFSIVPTTLSIDGIPEVIKFAKKQKIFASIGELERAGEVMKGNTLVDLSLTSDQITNLKTHADAYVENGCYMRPICPSILTGIHIDNIGQCIVDKKTGLNCKWFLLTEPDTKIIGNVRTESVKTLFNKVIAYRKNCFEVNKKIINECLNISYAFGGCGGNPKNIFELALKNL
jgi:MoaA/NifB/PqqE/SkfB family radical SAM enzyme